jgi:predicted enzyme related to lactoylglutathione lyase
MSDENRTPAGRVRHSDNPLARHGHVSYMEIPAVEPRRSAAFYEAVFSWHTRDNDTGGISFDDPAGNLIGRWDVGLAVAREPGILIFVYVDGIDDALERAVASGGEIIKPPRPEGDVWVATVRDPAGNVIGLWQFDPR